METIQHLPDDNKFVFNCDGAEAVLQYRISPSATGAVIDFTKTYVPVEFRGKGFAEKLVRTGVDWAKQQGYEMKASCWYAEKFIR